MSGAGDFIAVGDGPEHTSWPAPPKEPPSRPQPIPPWECPRADVRVSEINALLNTRLEAIDRELLETTRLAHELLEQCGWAHADHPTKKFARDLFDLMNHWEQFSLRRR